MGIRITENQIIFNVSTYFNHCSQSDTDRLNSTKSRNWIYKIWALHHVGTDKMVSVLCTTRASANCRVLECSWATGLSHRDHYITLYYHLGFPKLLRLFWELVSAQGRGNSVVTTSHVDIIHVATHVTSNQSVKKEEKICLSKFFVSQKREVTGQCSLVAGVSPHPEVEAVQGGDWPLDAVGAVDVSLR